MRLLNRIALSLAAFLLLTSPGFAPIGARTIETGIDARPALWVVKDDDTTIYLFGTIHVLKPGVRWFEGPVRRAYDEADTVVLEVLTPDRATMTAKTAALAMATDGKPLSGRLDTGARARYHALLASLGIPAAQLDPFQPWFAALTLSILPLEKLGYRADAGIEETLKAAAARDGKRLEALETVDEQLGYFAGLPEPAQIGFLVSTINDIPNAEADIARMVGHWAAGNPDALADEMNETLSDMPALSDALLFQRNARWARWIAARMARPGTLFVAIGAGHLAGSGSVIDDLAEAGLRAERLDRRR